MWFLAGIGLMAGVVTTVAGMGGGQLMLLALVLVASPAEALALTAPALLLGNLHRFLLFRGAVDWTTARQVALGALPGSLVGGLLAAGLPPGILHGMMVLMALLAVGRDVFGLRWAPSARWTTPVGLTTGLLTATGGGAGVIIGPFLLARGLSGDTYVATMALAAIAMHAGRLLAYGWAGMAGMDEIIGGIGLAVAITGGNLLGWRVRELMGEGAKRRAQLGAVVGCLVLALASA